MLLVAVGCSGGDETHSTPVGSGSVEKTAQSTQITEVNRGNTVLELPSAPGAIQIVPGAYSKGGASQDPNAGTPQAAKRQLLE